MSVGAIKRLATTVLMVRYYVCGHNERKYGYAKLKQQPRKSNFSNCRPPKIYSTDPLSLFYHVLFYHSKPIKLFPAQLGHVPTKEWYVN